MHTLATALCVTLLHSIWQSACLYGAWKISGTLFRKRSALASRNVLYALTFLQLILSVITGLILIYQPRWTPEILLPLQQFTIPFDIYLVWIYAMVVVWRWAILAFGYASLHRANHSYAKPDVHFKLYTEARSREMGIRRRVRLYIAQHIHTPLTYGFLKPVILLPATMVTGMSVREIEMILLHELSHIRYKDYLLNIYLLIVQQVYFFNPFFRAMAQKIRLERELNCDQWVLQYRYPAVEYAETLLKTAIGRKQTRLQLAAVSEKRELLKRIRYFALSPDVPKNNGFLICTSTLVLLSTMFILFMSGVQRTVPANMPMMAQKITEHNRVSTPPATAIMDENTTQEVRTAITVTKPVKTVPVKRLAPVAPEREFLASNVSEEHVVDNPVMIIPVNVQQLPQKLVTLTEVDAATGKTTVQSIRLVYLNDAWVIVPEWQVESFPAVDSLAVPEQ